MGTPRRLRIGLIGAGTIAMSAHLPAIARLRPLLELVAVADVRLEAAQAASARFGVKATADEGALLARPDLDLVLIATPEMLHHRQTLAAAAAGKHVLCEKPMAATVAEADAMIAACRDAGVKLMIGHSRRFTPRYQVVRAAIDRGEIGEVRLVRENERRAAAMYNALDQWAGYWTPPGDDARPWLARAAFTRGAAVTNAVHEMDLLRWYAGSDAVSVYAVSRITDPEAEVPDFVTCSVRFANGALGATEVVNRLPPGYPIAHMLEVFGTEGMLRATDDTMSTLSITGQHGTTHPANFRTLLHVATAYETQLHSFADAIVSDTPVPLDPWDARQALAMSLAAVKSSATGRVVHLTEATS